jgi:hypothetical protein
VEQAEYIDPSQVSDDRAPTARQWFTIAAVALEALGHDQPQSRREATALINDLLQTNALRQSVAWPQIWTQPN